MLAHNVFFTLSDKSDDAIANLVAECHKHLKGHEGTVFFAAGGLIPDLDRPVNVRDFEVALHVVFDGRESHDKYQLDPRHLEFIENNKSNWASVRVFDSNVE
ncbi:MAG: hypothetical protein ACI9G1_003894 [Pirellulaceae bacterium]|jgi:hypothetical protein